MKRLCVIVLTSFFVFALLAPMGGVLAVELTDEEKEVLKAEAKEKAELKAQAEGDATGNRTSIVSNGTSEMWWHRSFRRYSNEGERNSRG